jgi:formate hydrogenlyase subunit 4
LAGLETGTAFGGIGACRTMTFATVAEPAMLLVIFALALLAGTTNLDAIATMLREGSLGPLLSLGFALVAIVLVAIAEGGRAPIDNAATRAEPAMVREAMVLEYSARHLALLEWAAALKLLLWLSLIATIFVPFGMATPQSGPLVWLLAPAVWALKVAALATVLSLFESAIAGMRVLRVPEFLGVAVLLGLLAVVFLFVSQGFV